MSKFIIYFFVLLLKFDALPSQELFESNDEANDNPIPESNYESDYPRQPTSSPESSNPPSLNIQICRIDKPCSNAEHSIMVGASTYQELIENSCYWSDKSNLIDVILKSRYKIHVITCPRRSGKSMNLNMIATFVEIPRDDNDEELPLNSSFSYKYFVMGTITSENTDGDDIKVIPPPIISKKEMVIKRYLGKFPVIYLSFGSIEIDNNLEDFKKTIGKLYSKHEYVLDATSPSRSYIFSADTIDQFRRIQKSLIGNYDLKDTVTFLSEVLYKYYKKKVMIFIDEYDNFIDELLITRNRDKNLDIDKHLKFYRKFLLESCKENPFLQKAILTGIVKIGEMCGFSNWEGGARVVNLMEPTEFNEYYRFTTNEVKEFLSLAKNPNYTPHWYTFNRENFSMEAIEKYYDGYTTYGNEQTFSSFSSISIASFLNLAKLDCYWIQSGKIEDFWTLFRFKIFEVAISDLYDYGDHPLPITAVQDINRQELENLYVFIHNNSISEGFTIKNLITSLSVLSFMGYLTPKKNSRNYEDGTFLVRIPNMEIRNAFCRHWKEFILHPDIANTVNNHLNCTPEKKSQILINLISFFNVIMEHTVSDPKKFMLRQLQNLFFNTNIEDVEENSNKLVEVWQSTKKKKFQKVFDMWKILRKLCLSFKCRS